MATAFIFHGTAGHPQENWFPWLREELEKRGCSVIVPQFPTPQGQTLENWRSVFERYAADFAQDTILVAHSLGGAFALRVLERSGVRIRAAFLVATPIGVLPIKNYDGDRLFIGKPFDWKKIRQRCGKFVVFHSDDDAMVSVGNGVELARNLDAELVRLPHAGHFNAKAGYLKFDLLLEKMEPLLE